MPGFPMHFGEVMCAHGYQPCFLFTEGRKKNTEENIPRKIPPWWCTAKLERKIMWKNMDESLERWCEGKKILCP